MFTESNVHSPIFNMFLLIVKVLIFNKYFFKHYICFILGEKSNFTNKGSHLLWRGSIGLIYPKGQFLIVQIMTTRPVMGQM